METFDLLNFEIVDLSDLTVLGNNSRTYSKKKKDGGCGLFSGRCNPGCGCGVTAGICGMSKK